MAIRPVSTPLRRLRESRKQTLKDVSSALDIDTGNLSRIERGLQVSPDVAAKLVNYFGRQHISELEILYPERYPEDRKERRAT